MSLALSLKAPAETIRGESTFFDASLKNASAVPFDGIRPFCGDGAGLSLVLTPVGAVAPVLGELAAPKIPGQKIAGEGSFSDREGVHVHGPDGRIRDGLSAGGQWNARGDILEWFGDLSPGTYTLFARYNSGYDIYESAPVPFKVLPAKPALNAVARHGDRHFAARPTGAFVHTTTGGRLLCVQVSSDALPKTPVRGIRIADIGEPTEIRPASMSSAMGPNAHCLLTDGKAWTIATAPLSGAAPALTPIAADIPGLVLQSPLSTSDGGVVIPFISTDMTKLYVLRLKPDGKLTAPPKPIVLDKAAPVGCYACCWQQEEALHFVWAAAGGREVYHAAHNLLDPDAPTAIRHIGTAPEPLLALDAWADGADALSTKPMFAETGGNDPKYADDPTPPPYRLKVWMVTGAPNAIRCHEIHVTYGQTRLGGTFPIEKDQKLRVVQSLVRCRGELCMLLADGAGALFYANTASGRLSPLKSLTTKPITLAQQPAIQAAGSRGTLPWVYVRYMDPAEGAIAYAKLEPVGESEPHDHAGHSH